MTDRDTTCPTCGTPVRVVGDTTKCYEPLSEGQDPQHPAPSAAQSVPTDEVREALHFADVALFRLADEGGDGGLDTSERFAVCDAGRAALATIEAALSRNTEHDRLMREVVDAADATMQAFHTLRNCDCIADCMAREVGSCQYGSVCDAAEKYRRLRLTDYEGSK